MLDFKQLEVKDRESVDPYLQSDGAIMSDRCFATLYIWAEHYGVETCELDGTLYTKAELGEGFTTYYMPLGGSLAHAAQVLEEDAAARGRPYEIVLLTEAGKAELEAAFPDKYEFEEQRSEFDYVYNAEDLINLTGKKYHGKRNFINRFKAEYAGRWEYSDVEPERDREEILEFLHEWCMQRDDENCEDYRYEYSAIRRALDNYHELGFLGGAIRLDGHMIAFTLACPQNGEVKEILIEKADAEIDGAYQMINKEFASRNAVGYRYINREEDMGIPGLRQAKLSYEPCGLTEKYRAVPR